MFYSVVTYLLAGLVDLVSAKWMSEDEKDLEIALLRQQLRIVERRQERGPHIPRWQKVPLAVLAHRLKERSEQAKEKLVDLSAETEARTTTYRSGTRILDCASGKGKSGAGL